MHRRTPLTTLTGTTHTRHELNTLLEAATEVVANAASAASAANAAIAALRTAVDALPDPYVVVVAERDPAGAVVDFTVDQANVAACRFMLWPHPLPTGVHVTTAMNDEPAALYVALGARVLADGEPLIIDRVPVDNGPDGQTRHYDARGMRIDADRLGFTWRDVTAQVEHDRALVALATMEAIADERERVARDLHDGAIQQVYATGLLLQAISTHAPESIRHELDRIIIEEGLIVDELRATIRGLLRPDLAHLSPADGLRRIVTEAGLTLGVTPSLDGHDALDTLDDPALVQHLLYATREMLSNVARHAAATVVDVTVQVSDADVSVEVVDNGTGADPSGRAGDRSPAGTSTGGLGLANLQRRAQVLGGSFELTARRPTGSVARWSAKR